MAKFGNAAITYRTAYNAIYNLIVSNCCNVDGTNKLPAVLLSGYSVTYKPSGHGDDNGYVKGSQKLTVSNPISAVSSSTISSQLATYVHTYVPSSIWDDNLSEDGLLILMNAIATFCSYRLRFATSILTTGRYLVYVSSGTVPPCTAKAATDAWINDLSIARCIRAATVNDVLSIIANRISTTTRNYIVTYSTSYGYS